MPINEESVLTWTGTSAKLYLNGNLIATATMPTLIGVRMVLTWKILL